MGVDTAGMYSPPKTNMEPVRVALKKKSNFPETHVSFQVFIHFLLLTTL